VAVTERPSTATVVRITLTVAAVGVLLYAIFLVRQVVVLVIVALFLAIGLDPLVRALARLRLSRGQAVLAVFLGVIIFVGGFFAAVTPPLVRQTQRLAREIPDFASELSTRSSRFRELDERYEISRRLRETVKELPSLASRSAGSALGIARSIGRTLFAVLTVMILTIYFLVDLPKLMAGAAKLVPKSRRMAAEGHAQIVFDRISGYIVGNLAVSVIAGVVTFIALTALRVPYALPLAMWVAIADLIPMVGATLGAIPAVIVAFFASLWSGIGALIFYAVYQQVENYVITPRVMTRAVDISAAAVLLAALIGGTLLGFVGALLAIPIAASIKVLVQEIWFPRQEAA
jgi:predicted PurR-regulated permease PerM